MLGVRQGVLDAAERLRHDGHDVLVVDLFGGRTLDGYPPAMAFAEEEVGEWFTSSEPTMSPEATG